MQNSFPSAQAGLSGLQKRFVPMGGGIKPEQLQWLREVAVIDSFIVTIVIRPGASSSVLAPSSDALCP